MTTTRRVFFLETNNDPTKADLEAIRVAFLNAKTLTARQAPMILPFVFLIFTIAVLGSLKLVYDQRQTDSHLRSTGCHVVGTKPISVGNGGIERTWSCPDGTSVSTNW